MKRLFTFGCSFTSYSWSTWADILGSTAEEFQNWGMSGTGNQFILASVAECHQRNQFRLDDTVIVCWTNIMRDDRYSNGCWSTLGNIYTQPLYDPAWVRQWISERGCLLRDLAALSAVTHMLKSHGVDWRFLSMVPFDQADQYSPESNPNQDLVSLYSDYLSEIKPSFLEVLPDRVPLSFDGHPSPADHLRYLDRVLSEFDIPHSTRVQIQQEDDLVRAPGYKRPSAIPPKISRA
jgi:hypothetical protein